MTSKLATCERHGLTYDPAQGEGCSMCRALTDSTPTRRPDEPARQPHSALGGFRPSRHRGHDTKVGPGPSRLGPKTTARDLDPKRAGEPGWTAAKTTARELSPKRKEAAFEGFEPDDETRPSQLDTHRPDPRTTARGYRLGGPTTRRVGSPLGSASRSATRPPTREREAPRGPSASGPSGWIALALSALFAVVAYDRFANPPTPPAGSEGPAPKGLPPGANPATLATGSSQAPAPSVAAEPLEDSPERGPAPYRQWGELGKVAPICRLPWTRMHGRDGSPNRSRQAAESHYADGAAVALGYSPLILAIESGDEPRAFSLIGQRSLISVASKRKEVPLHFAARSGRTRLVQALLAAGADVQASNDRGETPLMLAAEAGAEATVAVLIDAGATLDARDHLNHTALMRAARKDRLEVALSLIDAGADPRARGLWDERGGSMTVLDAAWKNGANATAGAIQRRVVQAFRSLEGRDLTAIDDAGNTPLHWLARYSGASVAETLIARGAPLEMKNCPSRDSDDLGPHRDDLRFATPLLIAVSRGNLKVARSLLAAGADARALDERGRGVFHVVQSAEVLSLVPDLLSRGARPDEPDRDGQRPADLLAKRGLRAEFSAALEARGIRVAAGPPSRDDLFGLIARLGRERTPIGGRDNAERVLELLDQNPSLIGQLDERGRSALHDAAHYGLPRVAEALVSRGADVSLRDREGRTALHHARAATTVSALSRLGADLNARDAAGRTPLHLCALGQRPPEVLRALLEAGARRDVSDARGRTPLALARQRSDAEATAALEAP